MKPKPTIRFVLLSTSILLREPLVSTSPGPGGSAPLVPRNRTTVVQGEVLSRVLANDTLIIQQSAFDWAIDDRFREVVDRPFVFSGPCVMIMSSARRMYGGYCHCPISLWVCGVVLIKSLSFLFCLIYNFMRQLYGDVNDLYNFSWLVLPSNVLDSFNMR
jgi:hypothetical protein